MKLILALLLVASNAQASRLVDASQKQYFASVGLGSTQSVVYTGTAQSVRIIASTGPTELVSVLTTTDAYVFQDPSVVASAANGMYLPAKIPMILEVLSGNLVSAVMATSGGTLFVSHLPTFPNNK